MTSRHALASIAVVTTLVLFSGCIRSVRPPQILARGELAVTMDRRLTLSAEGRVVARSPVFRDLPDYVGCTEPARTHALEARRAGRRARAFSILGATLGLGALVGFGALADRDHVGGYLGASIGSGLVGLGFATAGFTRKRLAFGRALDAANEYNDAVGSLGATCLDLRYPAPAGPASPLPYPTQP